MHRTVHGAKEAIVSVRPTTTPSALSCLTSGFGAAFVSVRYLYIMESSMEQNLSFCVLFNPFKCRFCSVEDYVTKEYFDNSVFSPYANAPGSSSTLRPCWHTALSQPPHL